MNDMKDKIKRLEKNQIRNNIVLTGLNMDTENREAWTYAMEFHGTNNKGENTGDRCDKNRRKDMQDWMQHPYDKQKIIKNKNKLKLHKDRIFINNE